MSAKARKAGAAPSHAGAPAVRSVTPRSQVLDQLERYGGRHLVVVRYGLDHVFHKGWVYNDADIDSSQVVWARELDSARNQRLLGYYPERTAWLFEPDQSPPRLSPYGKAGSEPERGLEPAAAR